jgi:hypothetical protein
MNYGQSKLLSISALIVLLMLLYFPARFATTFELLGNPVVSPGVGWLGPTPRNAGACVLDVGKVNAWLCPDTSVFTEHRFGCQLWLRVFGYHDA